MIKTIGITLKGSRSIYVILEGLPDDFRVVDAGYIELKDSKDQALVKAFQSQWMELIDTNDFHAIAIKARVSKGRFAGGALTFKMEGLIQLSDYPIQLIHDARMRSKLKDLDPSFGNIKAYQEDAAKVAYYLLLVQ